MKNGSPAPCPEPIAPYILYFDSASQTLALGAWGKDVTLSNIVYAQSGSTIALRGGANGDAFDAADVVWSPSVITIAMWGDIAAATKNGVARGNISVATDNDICRFVGLTAAEARKKGALSSYDSGFRLPTSAENRDFVSGGYFIRKASPTVAYFPDNQEETGVLLPAAGFRDAVGVCSDIGNNGYYSNIIFDEYAAHLAEPIATSCARTIRCVPK